MRVDLDFPLRSKSNYRRRPGERSWSVNRGFEDSVRYLGKAALPKGWVLGDAAASLADRPTVVMLIVATTLLDTANLAKSAADALEGVAYHNDASVRLVTCTSERSKSGQRACILLGLCAPGATITEMHEASIELMADYLADPSASN